MGIYGIAYSIPMLAILPPYTYYALEAQNGKLLEKFLKRMDKNVILCRKT